MEDRHLRTEGRKGSRKWQERWLLEKDPNGDVYGMYLHQLDDTTAECSWCNKTFKFHHCGKYDLKRHSGLLCHMETKDPLFPQMRKCNICSKVFTDGAKTSKHMLKHKYKCNKCPKAFGYKYNLEKHLQTHHGLLSLPLYDGLASPKPLYSLSLAAPPPLAWRPWTSVPPLDPAPAPALAPPSVPAGLPEAQSLALLQQQQAAAIFLIGRCPGCREGPGVAKIQWGS
jgi:hypothetical protein